jgi:rubredoxin
MQSASMMSLSLLMLLAVHSAVAFQPAVVSTTRRISSRLAVRQTSTYPSSTSSSPWQQLRMSISDNDNENNSDPMSAAMDDIVDDATRQAMEKMRKAEELRAQEVFMKKSTGKHKCSNCDWLYDQDKGDVMMIGGLVQPGTVFDELPSNWRCPVCRASKDSFLEVVEEIPGFEVNQGYGFGTNSWTAGQKNAAIFGGLGLFFVLFLSGYAMS